jgi:cellulose synthase/poly-beta-1,6-N-acetylglucosamine synthase-like glycosyltransferase
MYLTIGIGFIIIYASNKKIALKKGEDTETQRIYKDVIDLRATVIIAHNPNRDSLLLEEIKTALKNEDLEVLVSSKGNKSESRNEMAKKAKGDILIFLDDDIKLRGNTIEELLKPFSLFSNVGVVGGVNQTFPNASKREILAGKLLSNSIATFKSSARYTPKGGIRESDESELQSCNIAILNEAFFKAGGFPIHIIPCEENVLLNRIAKLGYKLIYNPYALVYHRRPKLFREYAKTLFDYGKGRGLMLRRGEGKPKMLPKLSADTFLLILGYCVHVISYVSGVIYGYLKG